MEPVSGLQSLLTSITAIVSAAMGWAGDVVTFITASGHELVLAFVAVSFVGLGVGLVRRMLRI